PPFARNRHDQIEPAEDHRQQHRLALFERAQARAEGVKRQTTNGRSQGIPMRDQAVQGVSRRAFPRGLTLAGTTGLLGVRPGLAVAEPPPETTTLRLLKETAESAGPPSMSLRTCCGPKASPT